MENTSKKESTVTASAFIWLVLITGILGIAVNRYGEVQSSQVSAEEHRQIVMKKCVDEYHTDAVVHENVENNAITWYSSGDQSPKTVESLNGKVENLTSELEQSNKQLNKLNKLVGCVFDN